MNKYNLKSVLFFSLSIFFILGLSTPIIANDSNIQCNSIPFGIILIENSIIIQDGIIKENFSIENIIIEEIFDQKGIIKNLTPIKSIAIEQGIIRGEILFDLISIEAIAQNKNIQNINIDSIS